MLKINHIVKYNNDSEYNNIAHYLYFYREYYVNECYYKTLGNIYPNCNICNMPIQLQNKYISKDKTVNGFSLSVCLRCSHNIVDIDRINKIKKHYGLVTLLSQQLLTNYLPEGYIIPQIPNLIIKKIINININSRYMDKYKI